MTGFLNEALSPSGKTTAGSRMVCYVTVLATLVVCAQTGSWYVPDSVDRASAVTRFIFVKNQVTWRVAYDACGKLGGTLARIDTPYLQEKITSFISTDWHSDWDKAWISLIWRPTSATTQQLVWADNCASLNSTLWDNFETSEESNYEDMEDCYLIDKDTLRWDRTKCTSKKNFICAKTEYYNFTKVQPYTAVDATMVAVNLSGASITDCRELCDYVYGCFMTSYAGDTGCVLAVVGPASNTFVRVSRCIADVHEFTSQEISDIQKNVSGITACDVTIKNVELPDGYISASGLATVGGLACAKVTSSPCLTSHDTHSVTQTIAVTSTPSVTTTEEVASERTAHSTPVIPAPPSADARPPCPCTGGSLARNLSGLERQAVLNAIVQELTVDAKSTRRSQLKLSSADDRRSSAQAVGYVAVGVIFTVVCVILAIDAPKVYHCVIAKMDHVHTSK